MVVPVEPLRSQFSPSFQGYGRSRLSDPPPKKKKIHHWWNRERGRTVCFQPWTGLRCRFVAATATIWHVFNPILWFTFCLWVSNWLFWPQPLGLWLAGPSKWRMGGRIPPSASSVALLGWDSDAGMSHSSVMKKENYFPVDSCSITKASFFVTYFFKHIKSSKWTTKVVTRNVFKFGFKVLLKLFWLGEAESYSFIFWKQIRGYDRKWLYSSCCKH